MSLVTGVIEPAHVAPEYREGQVIQPSEPMSREEGSFDSYRKSRSCKREGWRPTPARIDHTPSSRRAPDS
jgi:hypothetical protein